VWLLVVLVTAGCSLIDASAGGADVTPTVDSGAVGTAIIRVETAPAGQAGAFQFTGVPTGTVTVDSTLVVSDLEPGTYTTTQVDPAPGFDVTAVRCDDGDSDTVSRGDPLTRSAIFNVDPDEMVTCTFLNARRGTLIVTAEVEGQAADGAFQYTGVPSGTVSVGGTLVVTDLPPGTYTTTEVDPAPDFELTDVTCDDAGSATTSMGDAATRSAIFNLDAGETIRCVFRHEWVEQPTGPQDSAAGGGQGSDDEAPSERVPSDGVNPFENPGEDLADFPLPDDLPADASTYRVPKAGRWRVTNLAGQLDCGVTSLGIPASPPETGVIEVLDGGQTLVGRSLQEDPSVPITMAADPEILGRYTGAVEGMEEGIPVTLTFVWQVVTETSMVGYLTGSVTSEGVTCTVYRPYDMVWVGE